jgi:gluconate kinase
MAEAGSLNERPRLVLVAGKSCAGKTTLAELLKARRGFLHFDVDTWTRGGAYLEETRWPTPEEGEQWKATRSPELASAVENFHALCEAAKPGVPFPPDAVDDLLEMLCEEVLKVRGQHPDRDVVISWAPMSRAWRDTLRAGLGSDLECVILAVPDKLLETRQWDRLEQFMHNAMGLTLDEWIEKSNRENSTSTTREDLGKSWCGSSHLRHFDLAQDGEPRTQGITVTEEMTPDDVFRRAEAVLGLQS